MSLITVLALVFAAFALLCLGMERHHREVLGVRATRRRRVAFRTGGSTLLALSGAIACYVEGFAMGAVRWTGALSICAVAIPFLLAYRRSGPHSEVTKE